MKFLYIFIFTLVSVSVSPALLAQTAEFNEYLGKANVGDLEAKAQVGIAYYNGDGISQDRIKAYDYLLAGAEAGNARAQGLFGECYELGHCGQPKDLNKARYWFEKAANQGDGFGLYSMGWIYKDMSDFAGTKKTSCDYFQRSADVGYTNANYSLAHCYLLGKGRDYNDAKAYENFKIAAEAGHGRAKQKQKFLEEAYLKRGEVLPGYGSSQSEKPVQGKTIALYNKNKEARKKEDEENAIFDSMIDSLTGSGSSTSITDGMSEIREERQYDFARSVEKCRITRTETSCDSNHHLKGTRIETDLLRAARKDYDDVCREGVKAACVNLNTFILLDPATTETEVRDLKPLFEKYCRIDSNKTACFILEKM